METAFDKISPLIPFSLFVLVICSILALGFLSSQGFERFYTLPFWSVLGPAMAIGVLLGGFVGIMAAAAPTVSNGSMTLTLVGASVFLLITWIGIFPAYFLLGFKAHKSAFELILNVSQHQALPDLLPLTGN